ncbi:hypothetical protein DPMN_123199 [Dreissena polymorpha]|uniref:Uncharacterized protein n=1 Tax=Dreissena polymorpha TaxID=45954 RepID=A0A9D4JR24_DREPO|nr:hypothetical protein DPMN_123199 [Dreissena polymorpha]
MKTKRQQAETGHQDSNRASGQQWGIGSATGHRDSKRASGQQQGIRVFGRTSVVHKDSKRA